LQVLVSLRVNREAALEALRKAERESSAPIPHPSARLIAPSTDWARQGLRLAATVALVAIVSVWAAGGFFGVGKTDTAALATRDYESAAAPTGPRVVDLTSDSKLSAQMWAAYEAMDNEHFEEATRILTGLPFDDSGGRVRLYLGMSHYFLKDYDRALEHLSAVREMPGVSESAVLHQAAWYEANALLADGQPLNAATILEGMKASPANYPFQNKASALYSRLCEAMGIASSKQD
jgi:hypothetical protein